MANKFEWNEKEAPKAVKQKDLICKDCFHRGGRIDICAAYPDVKPYRVLDGGNCTHYKKEETE